MNFSVFKLIKFLFFICFAVYFTSAFFAFIAFYVFYFCVGVLTMLFYRFSEDKNKDLNDLSKKFNKQYRLNNLLYDLAQNIMNTNSVKERFKLFKEYIKNGHAINREK